MTTDKTPDQAQTTPGAALSISVVMPAYNAAHYMPVVLEPLLEMLNAGEISEIIVVDDQSSDDTAQVAADLGARVLTNPERGGPGAARNFAARHAAGDIIWLVDSDVIAHPGGGAKIRAAFADDSVHAVFGSYDDSPAGQSWISLYKNLVHRYYHQRAPHEAETFWAGCGALRKSAFLAVGGFDVETYKRPSIEDIELGYRIRDAGGRILLLPELLGKHLKVWTLRNVIHTDIFCRALPWSRLLISRDGLADNLNTSRAERGKAILAGVFLLSIPMVLFRPGLWWVPLLLLAAVLAANAGLFAFLWRAGGAWLAIRGVLFHQVYYVYSSAVYAWCLLENMLWRRKSRATQRS